ncbi:MAG: hypothetical protein LC790_01365 [Actinobacteria bacterium]|nr:hypothetical protein [Actinomycetota bacterium]
MKILTATSRRQAGAAVGPVGLADTLGWASSVLGAPMCLTPRRLLRAIGVQDDRRAVAWTIGVGLREHLATLNIIANRQRRIGMWSRVAGDTMDLALLAGAYRIRRAHDGRLRATIGLVGGLLVVDLATALALTRADGSLVADGSESAGVGADHGAATGPTRVRTAATIRGSQDDVRAAFEAFEWSVFDPQALCVNGDVRFVRAPGGRGTEVHIDHDPGGRGGSVGATARTVLGTSAAQTINDELRRLKAMFETGVVARSETSPEGPSATRQIFHKRQPAQPMATES